MKIDILSRFSGEIIFSHEAEENSIKKTVEAAVKIGASLDGASLDGASLDGASLDGASLDGASLDGARLDGASLVRARLDGEKIQDIKQIGNIGSRGGFTVCFKLEKSIKINCGCFWGTLDEFVQKVKDTHEENEHAFNYLAMVDFIKKIWKVEE